MERSRSIFRAFFFSFSFPFWQLSKFWRLQSFLLAGEIDKGFGYFFSVLLFHLQGVRKSLPPSRREQLLWLIESPLFATGSNQASHRCFSEPRSQPGYSLAYFYISAFLVSCTALLSVFPSYTVGHTPQTSQVAPSHIDPTPSG